MTELVRRQPGIGRVSGQGALQKRTGGSAPVREATLLHALHRLEILLCSALVFLLTGGGIPVTAIAASEPASAGGANATVSLDEVPVWIHPSPYIYESSGKQDPFMPFIRKVAEERLAPSPEKPVRARTPLEQVEVTELRLEGILWSAADPEAALAMVALPDGKGFILRKGMTVGSRQGVIIEIAHDKVTVEERYVTLFGEEKDRLVSLKLYSEDGKK